MTQPALINLHYNEFSQEFQYYIFGIKLDRYVKGCNSLNDLSNKVCVPNKTEDLHLTMFSMITGSNESKTLTKHANVIVDLIAENITQISVAITINVDMNVKNVMYVKKMEIN